MLDPLELLVPVLLSLALERCPDCSSQGVHVAAVRSHSMSLWSFTLDAPRANDIQRRLGTQLISLVL